RQAFVGFAFEEPLERGQREVSQRDVPEIHAVELASVAFAQVEFLHRERHVLSSAYELHAFFEITALSTSRSRLKSATRCFSRRFSSSCRSRLASLTCMPPYLPFHAYSVAALTPNSRATSAVLRPPSICF